MSLRRNVIANYLGQGWRAIMGIAFLPLYVRYLGIEAYGLIGIFAIMQAWLVLLDMGLKPALGREMARFTASALTADSIRDLLRSVELIAVGVALAISVVIWLGSEWLAENLIRVDSLDQRKVSQAFSLMGVVAALRFIEDIYVSSVVGLQKQVQENIAACLVATLRGAGAVAILHYVSASITAFFMWQALMSCLSTLIFAWLVYRSLPHASRAGRFSIQALESIRRFATGMVAIVFLSLLLTQLDKILVARLLPLREFGYYSLAGVITASLYMLSAPITAAFYPRFTEMVTSGNDQALVQTYHRAAQLVTVALGTVAVMLVVFSERILLLWSHDPALAAAVAPILRVLALGTLLNGLMGVPYHLQLAHGWINLAVRVNVCAVFVLVPLLFWAVPRFGSLGAAWVWVALNAAYVVFVIFFMHRRLMPEERNRWYATDVSLPLLSAVVVAAACSRAFPPSANQWVELCVIAFCTAAVLLASALTAPAIRCQLYPRAALR